jgi:hypothetical protein
MGCLFCYGMEKDYKPPNGIDYICSSCVLLLADVNQDDLKRAYIKAEAKGLENKASALKSFIIEDEHNVRKTKNSKRNMERKRFVRSSRSTRN